MGKFLLSLMCLLAVGFTTNAETIESHPKIWDDPKTNM